MKIHKLSALAVAVVSCAYLSAMPSHANNNTSEKTAKKASLTYPVTRSHDEVEDKFLSGEFGISANTASTIGAGGGYDPSIHKPDDGVDRLPNGVFKDKFRWLEEYDPISPTIAKETDADRERNFIGTRQEDDRPLEAQKTKFLQTVAPKTSSEVNDWVNAQNEFANNYIQNLPIYENLKANQRSLKYTEREYSVTKRDGVGEFRYYRDTDGYRHLVLTRDDGSKTVLINEKNLTPEGSAFNYRMGGVRISPEGNYVAFFVRNGFADADESVLHVISTKTGELATPIIQTDTRAEIPSRYRWYDEHTLYYTGHGYQLYARDMKGKRLLDPVVMSQDDIEGGGSTGSFSFYGEDKRYIVMNTYYWIPTVHIKDLHTGKTYRIHNPKFLDHIRAKGTSFNNDILAKLVHFDPETKDVYIISGENDARGQIIKTNLTNTKKREVKVKFDENFDLIREAIFHDEGDGYFVVTWLKDGVSHITLISAKTGETLKELTPPEGAGYIHSLVTNVVGKETEADVEEDEDDAEANENYIRFTFENPTFPATHYKYSIAKDKFLDIRRSDLVPFDHTQYETKLVKYKSYDGTEVPMNISYKKGIKLDGSNPTILYAYGGYGSIYEQMFGFPAMTEWLENGGVWAHAFIRGGGEYGENWQNAARHANRTIGYDDFAAAADYLNEQGYARPDKIGINGGSNGGQLVGVETVRHPSKYAVALPDVGVFDIYRHEKMGVTQYWMGELGTPDEGKRTAEIIRSYSPYHNVNKGVCYPATLVSASKRDDRVVPSHTYKFGAALQEAQSCNRPILIWNAEDAGHNPNTVDERHLPNLNAVAFAFNEMGVTHVPIIDRPSPEFFKTDKWRAEEARKAERKAKKKAEAEAKKDEKKETDKK